MATHDSQGDEGVALADLDVPTNDIHRALAARRRRFVLACLAEHATPLALADVADELVTWERDAPIPEVPAEAVKRAYLSLYHAHVPKLADVGLVEYDQEHDVVAPTETVPALADILSLPEPGRAGDQPDPTPR